MLYVVSSKHRFFFKKKKEIEEEIENECGSPGIMPTTEVRVAAGCPTPSSTIGLFFTQSTSVMIRGGPHMP
jgi:hypothetical protein